MVDIRLDMFLREKYIIYKSSVQYNITLFSILYLYSVWH